MTSKPWSHRLPLWGRLVTTCFSAAVCALIGTFVHRGGAMNNLPYGFALAMLLLLLSAWCARSRSGWWGLFVHAIVFSIVVWILALGFIGSAVLVPVGFTVPMPWCAQYVGYFWIYGVLVAHVVLLFLRNKFFTISDSK